MNAPFASSAAIALSRQQNPSTEADRSTTRSTALKVTGITFVLLSGVCFFSMLSLPIWTLSTTAKGIVGGALFIGVQGFWWVGVALLGPTAIDAFRRRFRKRTDPPSSEEKS